MLTTKFQSQWFYRFVLVVVFEWERWADETYSSGNTRHRHAKPCWRNFCAVQKVGSEEANRDEEVEQEHKESASNLCSLVRLGETGCHGQSQHAGRHTCTTEHEQLAATEAVDGEEGDKTG
jgi:hypothetical protein